MSNLCHPPPKGNTHKLKTELARYDASEPLGALSAARRVVRARAKDIIEGRRPWPAALLEWKGRRELEYYHGDGARPPWLDERNLTKPQRERALFADRAHAVLVGRYHAAVKVRDPDAMSAACAAIHEFYARENAA